MNTSTQTNWGRLARALHYYVAKGFIQTELPWCAPKEICALTYDNDEGMYVFDDQYLVGSAEQSFINAQHKNLLQPGNYVSLTPCFRREPIVDETHLLHFMKVELFSAHDQSKSTPLDFAVLAQEFMKGETSHDVQLVSTHEGYDLEINGIEVGSYGPRKGAGMFWTCGTGLAEPRFTIAVDKA